MSESATKINQALKLLSQAKNLLKQVNSSLSNKVSVSLTELSESLKEEIKEITTNQEAFLLKELQLAEKTENNVYRTTKLGIKYLSVIQTTNKNELRSHKSKGQHRSSLQSAIAKNRNKLKDLHGKLNALKIEREANRSTLKQNEKVR